MIVIDSSIWIDHLHIPEPELVALLMRDHALMHPHVLGEIALGSIRNREFVLARFELLTVPNVAEEGYVLYLIDEHGLAATGIGYTDAHLLASALLMPGGQLWTRDKRLHAQAERLGVAFQP
ncbi:MAG: type II toxin-antitoxin system VapC family toxin [Sphingomicrobium sp.]|nr:type II toxin-antitoxin system VapC family toxin [Sphingomonadales bacterium]